MLFAAAVFLQAVPTVAANSNPTGIFAEIQVTDGCEGTDPSCRKKPFIGTVKVLKNAITLVAEKATDGRGEMRISLPPGRYRVVPQLGQKTSSSGNFADVIVYQNKFTSVTLFLH